MAWTTPITAVFNTAFTAAQWNASIRDNLNATEAGLATTAGRWFVATGATAIAERVISNATVLTEESTASTSYTALATAGPAVTITTGTSAMVFFGSLIRNSTADAGNHVSVAVSGATTVASDDDWSIFLDGRTASNSSRMCSMRYFTGLTAGSNTFTMQYRVVAGTGTFGDREICVVAF